MDKVPDPRVRKISDTPMQHNDARMDVFLIVPGNPELSSRLAAERFEAPRALDAFVKAGDVVLLQGIDHRFVDYCRN